MKPRVFKSNKKIGMVLAIIFSFAAMVNALFAQETIIKRGIILSVEKKDGSVHTGELVRAIDDSFFLCKSDSVPMFSVHIGDIKTIIIERSSTPGAIIGVVAGSIAGGFAGAKIGEMSVSDVQGGIWSGFYTGFAKMGASLMGTIIGVPTGALLGGFIGGAISGKDKIIPID